MPKIPNWSKKAKRKWVNDESRVYMAVEKAIDEWWVKVYSLSSPKGEYEVKEEIIYDGGSYRQKDYAIKYAIVFMKKNPDIDEDTMSHEVNEVDIGTDLPYPRKDWLEYKKGFNQKYKDYKYA